MSIEIKILIYFRILSRKVINTFMYDQAKPILSFHDLMHDSYYENDYPWVGKNPQYSWYSVREIIEKSEESIEKEIIKKIADKDQLKFEFYMTNREEINV